MIRDFWLLALGWVPLWGFALWRRREIRFGRVAFGAALLGLIGGICSVELRRHGLCLTPPGAWVLPVLDLHLDEVLRFSFQGAAGVIVAEVLLTRSGDSAAAPRPE